jgi:tetratricopeptide (TPR) repeat protein
LTEKALKIDKTNYKALFNLGVINKKLGNIQKAKEYYLKSIEENPYYPYSYFNLAYIYGEGGDYLTGIRLLSEGIKKNKDIAILYYNRSCYYALLGKKENALRDLITATRLDEKLISYMKKDKELDSIRDMKAYKLLFEE